MMIKFDRWLRNTRENCHQYLFQIVLKVIMQGKHCKTYMFQKINRWEDEYQCDDHESSSTTPMRCPIIILFYLPTGNNANSGNNFTETVSKSNKIVFSV